MVCDVGDKGMVCDVVLCGVFGFDLAECILLVT